MKVADAVAARFSARAFLDQPVPVRQIRRILDRARQAPSGGNLQPWHVWVVSGQPLRDLMSRVRNAALQAPHGEPLTRRAGHNGGKTLQAFFYAAVDIFS